MSKTSKSLLINLSVLPAALALVAFTTNVAKAQSVGQALQNWSNNQAGNVQQDANNGFISQGQANRLESKDAHIQNQEQQWMQQNGGHLTSGEKHKLADELQNVQHQTMYDAARDGHPAGGYPYATNGVPAFAPNYYHPQYNNPYAVNQSALQQNGLPVNAQGYGQNQYHHHHHQGFSQFGGNNFGGTNGTTSTTGGSFAQKIGQFFGNNSH
ncbi:MAG TPA: hypothetical protein V6C81_23810 [Planktothrix sp.]